MRRTVFAGVFALVTFALLSQFSFTAHAADLAAQAGRTDRPAAVNISRVKSMLKLTPEQESYWPPVEAALREVARQQQAHSEPAGFVRRVSQRVVSIVLNSAAVERLAVAARPLIAVLNQEQMRAASGLAQEMGLGPVVMAALK